MGSKQYPDYLNPFGDDDDDLACEDYPDHLDPFGEDEEVKGSSDTKAIGVRNSDDYDDSLNPFGEDLDNDDKLASNREACNLDSITINELSDKQLESSDYCNPFDVDDDHNETNSCSTDLNKELKNDNEVIRAESDTSNKISDPPYQLPSIESLEPPKPLPRTKSLLKKEQLRRRLLEQSNQQTPTPEMSNHEYNKADFISNLDKNQSSQPKIESVPRRKHKRAPPPVPVIFKRQVSGSLDAIEDELNDIGDQLALIEKESNGYQEKLKEPNATEESDYSSTRTNFIHLIKRKNSIVRRQKELMYQKREFQLDQIHSDIEYELRMIGNNQSARTEEDEAREKELLKRLVEIVEEKSDIIENLNKDTSCDNRDIKEAFKRLNLVCSSQEEPDEISQNTSPVPSPSPKIVSKSENCGKSGLNKFSKIATLLPKGNTIKGTIKMKRKRLFKKANESQPPIDQPKC